MKVGQADMLNKLYQITGKNNKVNDTGKKDETGFQDILDLQSSESKVTYSNINMSMNSMAVNSLMNGGDDVQGTVNRLISDLLKRQGYSAEQIQNGEIGDFDIDETSQAEAKKLIGPGGDLSPEKVSSRIVDFSIAAFGGDKSKIDVIRDAIDKGFAEAKKMLGGEISEVSKETYELIQEKLDKWIESDGGGETVETE
ncbi:MAG: hypothetical protein GY757_09725 [bacterium]|nr:hypothetical protein [bacterium]